MSDTIDRLRPLPDPVTKLPIADGVRIGHVHLKVADLERALSFYCGILGFELVQRRGREAAFISAGGYHHHIGLNTWESLGGRPPPLASACNRRQPLAADFPPGIEVRHWAIEVSAGTR